MRKDFRIKNYHNLNQAIKDYLETGNLTHYFLFFSRDDNSINSTIKNTQNSEGKSAVANNVSVLFDSPYKNILYTSLISKESDSYYRIPFGNANFKPFRNSRHSKTLAIWFALPKLWEVDGTPSSSTQIIFNKIKPGESSWIDEGEIALYYEQVDNSIRLSINGTNTDTSSPSINGTHFDLEITSKNLNSFSSPIRPGDWIHFAFTQEDLAQYSAPTPIEDAFKIYINGEPAFDSATGGDGGFYSSNAERISEYWRPFNNQGDMLLGRGEPDDNTPGLPGNIVLLDLAIWNTTLSSAAINSIYSTSQYFSGTGFLSLGPRVQVRQEINVGEAAYLTTTGIPKLNLDTKFNNIPYASEDPYDDSEMIIFENNVLKQLQYPLGLPADGIETNLRVSASLATPNSLPTIQAPGYTNTDILEKYYTPNQIKKSIKNKPFNDSLVAPYSTGSFYGPTTSIFGFSREVRNKIQLVIELPINEVSNVTRHSAHWDSTPTTNNYPYPNEVVTTTNINPHYDLDGEFNDIDVSGFLYYNVDRGIWEQKGLHDVVSGDLIPAAEVAQQTTAQKLYITNDSTSHEVEGMPKLNSGSFNFLRMFYPGGSYYSSGQYPGGGFGENDGNEPVVLNSSDIQLAANIGSPICSHGAPNAMQYFATSSQTIKMSDYIQEPFLLEKVVLEIEDTVARKIYDYSTYVNSPTAGRPQDDYVFFLMRQEKTFPGLNPQVPYHSHSQETISLEASSSIRHLICSGVATFYNNERRIPGKNPNNIVIPWKTYNSPTFEHNFNTPLNLTTDISPMIRTGSIKLEMEPAVASRKMYGNMFVPTWDGTHQLYVTQSFVKRTKYWSQCATVPGFWPGGTSTQPLSGSGLSGSRGDLHAAPINLALLSESNTNSELWWNNNNNGGIYNQRTFYEINPYLSPMDSTFFGRDIDSRTHKPFGGGGSTVLLKGSLVVEDHEDDKLFDQWNMGFADDLSKLNAPSPYLIFPEDELILGLDAALGWTATMAAGVTVDGTDQNGNAGGWDHRRVVGANNLTGSLLRLEAGQVMKLRFYGSMVKDQVQAPKYPKIDTTQNSISDPIIGSHVLDQYDISSIQANSGSYRERLITGSMTNGAGPARVENFGLSLVGEAVNSNAFHYLDGIPFELNPLHKGAIQSTVLTCSAPVSLTGLKYPDGWGGATTGPPMSKFFIRFLSASNDFASSQSPPVGWKYAYQLDRVMFGNAGGANTDPDMGGNPQGKIFPAPDEIWVRTGYSYSQWDSINKQNIISLANAFNGVPPGDYDVDFNLTSTSSNNGSYSVVFGWAFDPSEGVPGISAKQLGDTKLHLAAEATATTGYSLRILQHSCSQYDDTGILCGYPNYSAGAEINFFSPPSQSTISTTYLEIDAVPPYPGEEWQEGDKILFLDPAVITLGPLFIGPGAPPDIFPRWTIWKDSAFTDPVTDNDVGNPGGDFGQGTYGYIFWPNDNYHRPGTEGWVPGTTTQLDDVYDPVTGLGTFYRPGPGGKQLGIVPDGESSLLGMLDQQDPLRALAATATRGNLGEFGSFNRFITIPCQKETYWDSAPPRVDLMWATMGLTPLERDLNDFAPPGTPLDGDIKLLLCGISAGTGTFSVQGTGTSGSNEPWGSLGNPFSSDWWASYPFEPRFAHQAGTSDPMIRRFGPDAVSSNEGGISAAVYWITNDVYKGWGQPWTQTLSSSLGVDWSYLMGYPSTVGHPGSGSWGSAQVGISLTMESQTYGQSPHLGELAKTSLKTFYGIGDGFGNLIESTNEYTHFPVDDALYDVADGGAPDINGLYPPIYRAFRRMKKPRGWKYGLINAMPQNTQAVFRSDRYGQFRDMLEGRVYSAFTIAGEAQPNNLTDTTAPVLVKFQKPVWDLHDADGKSGGHPGKIETVNPGDTRSGNLSLHATSSLPYFDQCWGSAASYPHGRDRPNEIGLDSVDLTLA